MNDRVSGHRHTTHGMFDEQTAKVILNEIANAATRTFTHCACMLRFYPS